MTITLNNNTTLLLEVIGGAVLLWIIILTFLSERLFRKSKEAQERQNGYIQTNNIVIADIYKEMEETDNDNSETQSKTNLRIADLDILNRKANSEISALAQEVKYVQSRIGVLELIKTTKEQKKRKPYKKRKSKNGKRKS